MNVHDLLDRDPLDVVRNSLAEGAGYIERLISDLGAVRDWNALRQGVALASAEPARAPEPLAPSQIEDILENGVFVPAMEGRLFGDDLVRLLLNPAQLEDLARRAQKESAYFRAWSEATGPEREPQKPKRRAQVVLRFDFRRLRNAACAAENDRDAALTARGGAAGKEKRILARRFSPLSGPQAAPAGASGAREASPGLDIKDDEPGRLVVTVSADAADLGVEDLGKALDVPFRASLGRLELKAEGSRKVSFESYAVLFLERSGQKDTGRKAPQRGTSTPLGHALEGAAPSAPEGTTERAPPQLRVCAQDAAFALLEIVFSRWEKEFPELSKGVNFTGTIGAVSLAGLEQTARREPRRVAALLDRSREIALGRSGDIRTVVERLKRRFKLPKGD